MEIVVYMEFHVEKNYFYLALCRTGKCDQRGGEWEQLKIISHGSKQIKLPNFKNFSKLDPNARKLET